MSLDGLAENWTRKTRLNGGYWTGTFEISTVDPDTLTAYYESWIGNHIAETSGGGAQSWEGMIYELELMTGNIAWRKSFDDMANKVAVNYQETRTSFLDRTPSQNLYGIKEEVIDYGGSGSSAAEAMRLKYLRNFAYPKSNPVGPVSLFPTAVLRVKVCGYIFTLNWKYATIDTTAGISTIITDILTNDSEFLEIGKIDSNTQEVEIEADIGNLDHAPMRAWDLIADDFLPMGDVDGDIWRFYVDNNRLTFYNELSMTPTYYVSAGSVRYSSSQNLDVPAWWVQPGVYRDLDFRTVGQEQDSIFLDNRDFIVEEVEVSASGGLVIKSLGYDDADFIASLQAFQDSGGGGGGGGGGKHKHKWRWGDMTDEQRAWWIGGKIGPAPPGTRNP